MTQTIPPPGDDAPTNVLPPAPPEGPPPEGEPPPARGMGWGMALALLVLVAVAGAAVAGYFLARGGGSSSPTTTPPPTATQPTTTALAAPGKVIVPDVTGLKEDKAAERLGAAHLTPKVVTKATKKPNGTVVSQTPLAGKQAKRNAVVTIVVDQGQPAVAVPDLTGVKVAAAGVRLQKAGLKAKTTPVTVAGKPAGTVLSQAPPAGTKLKPGSVVTLSVAHAAAKSAPTSTATSTSAPTSTAASTTTTSSPPSHPATATVPDVSGQVLADAADALARAGLYPNVVYIPGSQPLGTVLQQAKPAGSTTQWGSYVRINVAKGPKPPPDTQIPDVTQQPRAQAMQALSAAGFQTKVEYKPVASNVKNDVVLDEQPGSTAPKGALVILLVSKR